ncbi:hypothetical protein Syun_016057 [Stephania yunnanensis]|uniref:EF-hand domain-containing protein n=1 Tax=Stephania yunnanensis TaxID=152371 RepID=A0AAP0J5W8_9MAGN
MVSGNDPVEHFFNSLNAVKEALVPLESGIRRTAKGLELRLSGRRIEGDDCKVRASLKKRQFDDVISNERKRGLSFKMPFKAFLGTVLQNLGTKSCKNGEMSKRGHEVKDFVEKEGSCANCLQFALTWSLLVNGFAQAFPSPFKTGKKRFQKEYTQQNVGSSDCCKGTSSVRFFSKSKERELDGECRPAAMEFQSKDKVHKNGDILSLDLVLGFLFDQVIQNVQKLEQGMHEFSHGSCEGDSCSSSSSPQFDHLGVIKGLIRGGQADVNSFLGNLRFARVGGAPVSLVEVTTVKDESEDSLQPASKDESDGNLPQKIASGLLSIPLSNVERLRSTLSGVSLTELIELMPQLGRSSKEHPDKKKLFSVQDFFRYTESEGRRFFEELDRDGDGQVTLEDLEIAMRKRRLPRRYAREFMQRTRSHLFSKSFGWKQFLTLMEQKEPTILRAYTTLCLSKSGTLQKSEILASLQNAGLPANEENAVAMMRFLNADKEGSISYGHFRNFMLLLPSDRLKDDPRSIWFEAATVVAVAPPVEIPAGSVLKSALAGGLACALSTSLLHPVDTIKTRVQASTLSFPEIVSNLPQIGVTGLYRGSIPAILGQFSSHGLRTGIFEASKLVLINVAPTLPEIQVQSIASFCSTILGTAVRIPCEVLKQRLQAGIFNNVGEAIIGTLQQDGIKGFFRGTGATLCREVPFYVAGMGLYAESKKAAQHLLRRELEPWETIAVGALSGGLAAVVTTPFDVMKTRTMTAPQGLPVSMSMIAFTILRQEGPLGLFKGAIPRFFWIAPLGAMNFAGYELARKAMDKNEDLKVDDSR